MENTRKNLIRKAANHQAEADIQLLGMRAAAALVVGERSHSIPGGSGCLHRLPANGSKAPVAY